MSEQTSRHANAAELLDEIEGHAHFALKNSTTDGHPRTKLVTPNMKVAAASKHAAWRRKEYPVTFTHTETGEVYEGDGLVEVGFSAVVPVKPETDTIPNHQLRFRIGMTAINSPVAKRRFLPTPDWRKQWTSSVPANALYVANYNRVDPLPQEQDPTGQLANVLRVPFSLTYSENGQTHRELDLSALQDPNGSITEISALHSYIMHAKPRPLSAIRDPRLR